MNQKSISIVFIPGFMLDESLWDELVPLLPETWNIIRANLLQGETIAEIAQNIAKDAPKEFILVGFSLGGYIARSLTEQFPEKVSSLILIASSLRPDTEEQKQQKLTAIRLSTKEKFHGLSSISIAKTLHPADAQNKLLIKRIQKMGINLGYEAFVRQSLLNRKCGDINKISCPTLIISAAQDQLRSKEEALELSHKIRDSKLAVIENSGHMIPLEQPEQLAQIISEWINQ
ncbi:alpha/beta fold hydrolase [Acinetobacter sp. YK3]|uniref:alpha/beta fold hydrolase n=1 Tax=Acinetobacter sp. YK3 TaxID=1860097 RepID=UPI00084C1C9D|nr:alpha/beta hydrolase [Acinetobacter sp. YK3]OEC90273.1 alpha/beta hydrolase [Acinetobacter sp. YK3]